MTAGLPPAPACRPFPGRLCEVIQAGLDTGSKSLQGSRLSPSGPRSPLDILLDYLPMRFHQRRCIHQARSFRRAGTSCQTYYRLRDFTLARAESHIRGRGSNPS